MRFFRKTFVLLAMVAFGGSCSGGREKSRYLALGDSYTIGENVPVESRWPMQLAKALIQNGLDVGEPEFVARSGWMTADLSTAMDRANPQGPFNLVTLLIGVNNQFRGRDPEEYRREFRALLKRSILLADGRASHVIVLSIPDWSVTPYAQDIDRATIANAIDQFNNIARTECRLLAVPFIDITSESRAAATQPALMSDDGLHPSTTMYAAWVQAVLPAAETALRK